MSTRTPHVCARGAGRALPLLGSLKASGAQTAGALEVIEYEGPIQPPPHVHREHDEAFYVLAGTFEFILGTEQVEVAEGGFAFVPRGTRHCFSTHDGARALLITLPAGLEGFFYELGSGIAAGKTSEQMRAALAGRYDSHPCDPA